ncbi:MAG: hypothetical protein ABRQ27_16240 [Clostridiaceae bacterium]
MRSTSENLLLWEDRINDRIKSGITIEEWCRMSSKIGSSSNLMIIENTNII